MVNLLNISHICKDSDIQKIRIGESFNICHIAKDSDIQKIRFKFFPESFECFEYTANFTIFCESFECFEYPAYFTFFCESFECFEYPANFTGITLTYLEEYMMRNSG